MVSRRSLALVFGAVLLLAGVLGFVPGVTTHDKLLGAFHVSALLNVVHIVVGAVAVVFARAENTLIGVGVFLLAFWTLGVVGWGGWIALTSDDNWLHLVLGAAMLAASRRAVQRLRFA